MSTPPNPRSQRQRRRAHPQQRRPIGRPDARQLTDTMRVSALAVQANWLAALDELQQEAPDGTRPALERVYCFLQHGGPDERLDESGIAVLRRVFQRTADTDPADLITPADIRAAEQHGGAFAPPSAFAEHFVIDALNGGGWEVRRAERGS